MGVPKAPVDENYGLASRKYKVWPTRKAAAAEAVAQATPMEPLAYEQLKRCVLLLDALHTVRALGLIEWVYHGPFLRLKIKDKDTCLPNGRP